MHAYFNSNAIELPSKCIIAIFLYDVETEMYQHPEVTQSFILYVIRYTKISE